LVKTREDMSEIDPSVFNKIDKVLFDSEDTLETYLNNVSN
jgi:hypothetical protein